MILDLQDCLQTLEKRIEKGPGSLNKDEVSNVDATLEQIVQNMNDIQQQQEQEQQLSSTQSSTSSSTPPVVTTDSIINKNVNNNNNENNVDNDNNKVSHDDDDDDENYQKLLYKAVLELDATTISSLLNNRMEKKNENDDCRHCRPQVLDPTMTNVAFWTVVQAVDQAEQDNVPLSDNIPCMLHHIFDADQEHLLQRTNNNNTTTTNNNNHTTNTTTNNKQQ